MTTVETQVDDSRSVLLHLWSLNTVMSIFIACVTYCVALLIYRQTLHPLAKFPGPKLAGLTYWYEFYYDVVLKGQYIFKIEKLHEQYGLVLRVNPNEIHISDPDFYSEIYHSKSYKTDRDLWYNLDFIGKSAAFTVDHDVHALRRAALANFFSTKSIRTLESGIKDVVSTMGERLHQVMLTGNVIDLRHLYSALTLDVISEYSFGASNSTGFMKDPKFGKFWVDIGDVQVPLNPFARHFKPVFRLFLKMPDWVAVKITPAIADLLAWQDKLMKPVEMALKKKEGQHEQYEYAEEKSLLHELIASPVLPPEDKLLGRIRDESFLLLAAGGETTASTLSRTTFHLLNNPEQLRKLREELKMAMPNAVGVPSLDTISQLPYLYAVVEEGLRIALPVPARLARVFQDHPLRYKEWTIPPGTAVSQSAYFTQIDPKIFPEPFKFRPERWLDNPGLPKYQVAFSKGRRMCIGINLANAEMRLALACIFRRFDLELFDTTKRNVRMAHDFFVSQAETGFKEIRVRVVKECL